MGPTYKAYNYCAGKHCSNHGSCKLLNNGYICSCDDVFKSRDCEVIDHCFGQHCNNNGNCTNGFNSYTCHCNAIFMGKNCETTNYCFQKGCSRHGTCQIVNNAYKCTCNSGYTGKDPRYIGDHCQTRNYCHGENCHSRGTFQNGGKTYSCHCKPGYSGKHCEHDSCYNKKRQHESTCQVVSGSSKYTCTIPQITSDLCVKHVTFAVVPIATVMEIVRTTNMIILVNVYQDT